MSRILCVIDGMTDPGFNKKDYPALDSMELIGYFQNTPEGFPTETLNCNLHLLGVDPIPRNIRGYVEAVGAGMEVSDDDLALRISWYLLDENGICIAPLDAPESIDLENSVYKKLGSYRAAVVLPHKAKLLNNLSTAAPYKTVGRHFSDFEPNGSTELKSFFNKECQEGRCPIFWAQAKKAKLDPLADRAAVICGTGTIKGIAKLLSMDLISVPTATGDTDTDLSAKVEAALKAADEYPFVFLHINGADEASHRLNKDEKHEFLLAADRKVISKLSSCGHDVIVTSDHGTDPDSGAHIGECQPHFRNSTF